MVRKAKELADKHGWYLTRQFDNEANPAYHRNTYVRKWLERCAPVNLLCTSRRLCICVAERGRRSC